MKEDKEEIVECKMPQADSEDRANLCCCYIVNKEGQYEDPCYLPVGDCC